MSNLYSILCSVNCLHSSWKQVKAKNSAGGIDGFTIPVFEERLNENLTSLLEELKSGKWNPEPYLRIEIPKNETEKRKLGLLSIRDKIVQQAIKNLIEPTFEKLFLNNSYGYRPEKGHNKAIRRTLSEFSAKKDGWVAQLDIDNYFDTINHDILFDRLQHYIKDDELLRLIQLTVKTGVVNKKLKWNEVKEGVPQGAVLSPLLANFYLHPFDQFVTTKTKSYVRYADDFLIITDTKEEIHELESKASEFLQKRLLLQLNKPLITEIKTGVEFLGIVIKHNTIALSEEKKVKLADRIRSVEIKNGHFTRRSMESIDGIKRYYSRLLPQEYLVPLDEILTQTVDSVIKNNYQSIPNKKGLITALQTIPFFSTQGELERNQHINHWCNLYSELKKENVNHGNTGNSKENNLKNQQLINLKKREYQKREGEGAELVVASFGSFIGKSSKGITVKVQGKTLKTPPSNALKHITVISKAVSISSDAIYYCMQNNIPVDFFDHKGHLYASILSPVSVESSLWQKQSNLLLEKKIHLSSRIIQGKLKNQLNLIKYFHKYHKEENEALAQKYNHAELQLENMLTKTKTIDASNENYAETLMSYEAAGATYYWGYIRQLITDDGVEFESRVRQGADDLFNSLLNYGYSLIYPRVWQAILSVKLNPTMGLLHVYQGGKPTLAYDLIEIFRAQAVDRVVISLIQKGEPLGMDKGYLNENTKKLLLQNIFERLNRYEKYRGEEIKFLKIIQKQAKELAGYIAGENKSFKPYLAKW